MGDFWRRAEIESRFARGTTFRNGEQFFGEVQLGRVVDSAVFMCDPCSGSMQGVELRVQARVDVAIRTRRRLRQTGGQPGQLLDLVWRGCIALSAAGGHRDQQYTWVQIFSDEPERIVRFDGTVQVEDVNQEHEPRPLTSDNSFGWAGRRWSIDSRSFSSARYSLVRPTLGSPNCDTIYDAPSASRATFGWMADNPSVRCVSKTTQFHSFVYHLPIIPAERQRVFLPRLQPDASVAWSLDQTWERDAHGAETRETQRRCRVHYIHPNGIVPPGMNRVLWRVFHGR